MEKYKLNTKDLDENFFHFTNVKNFKNIEAEGLLPYVGGNAKYIEKSKKVFFIEGLNNLLPLLDCWINCYYYIPVIPFIYKIGAFCLKKKWFPMIIADSYFHTLKVSKLHRKRAYRFADKLLDNSIVLQLALEENVDFKYDDDDEIKCWGYQKRHLELMGYSKNYSRLDVNTMDKWNMHTFSNRGVAKEKLKFCSLENGKYKLRDIFNYTLEKNKTIDLKNEYPVLYDYLNYKGIDIYE